MSDIFAQLFKIETEAQSIVTTARVDAEKTISKFKSEAASEIDAIQKTTDLLEKKQTAENALKLDVLREESTRKKTAKIADLRAVVERNFQRAIDEGIQLLEKLK